MNPHELKGLNVQLSKLKAEVSILNSEIGRLYNEMRDKNKAIEDIGLKIRAIEKENEEPTVTEHALLRYFERVEGRDFEAIKKTILPEETVKLIKQLGAGIYPVADFKIKVQGNKVVTVLKQKE